MSQVITSLFETIQSRKTETNPNSYTVSLFKAGENEVLKKIGEEAIEVIIAAKGEGDERVVYEMSDLLYHCMVLLSMRDLSWSDIEEELASRFK
ncbi:MAG TPA: phosphoribosyl-ATP diphosphatase [Caldilineaceae bacterium]|nr:phosphoribosyl-ATP diphosphatase [Caldilineaceae bacterium]